jgi:hypothetical protein
MFRMFVEMVDLAEDVLTAAAEEEEEGMSLGSNRHNICLPSARLVVKYVF